MNAQETLFVTVLGFILSQWVLKGCIEPKQDFNKLRGRIAEALTFHARTFHAKSAEAMPNGEVMVPACIEFRKLASELCGAYEVLPCFLKSKRTMKAAAELIGLSNMIGQNASDGAYNRRKIRILQNLDLKSIEDAPDEPLPAR